MLRPRRQRSHFFTTMEEEYVYQYYDPKTLLLVNQKVHTNEKEELFFQVFGRQYLHHHFRLLVKY